jgi:oligopeptide transport system ATP-binding protein
VAAVLAIESLDVRFRTPEGEVQAASNVSLRIDAGESVGVVGESGSGKTQLFLAVMGLLARNGQATGQVMFNGDNILNKPARALNRIRGNRISMIFQDPMTSLNPYLKISRQMTELLVEHRGLGEAEARVRSIEMLDRVGIPEADQRFDMYPHEFSGGMRQRAMIAMALLCGPELLIADEPTTALDVTIQAQILDLMAGLRRDIDTAVVMITHDLGVVAGLCDRVMVMYAGRVVETGTVRDIFHAPRHPYTQGLVHSMPRLDEAKAELLATIPGQPPNLQSLPPGCAFQDRCAHAFDRCRAEAPPLQETGPGRAKACHLEAAP